MCPSDDLEFSVDYPFLDLANGILVLLILAVAFYSHLNLMLSNICLIQNESSQAHASHLSF